MLRKIALSCLLFLVVGIILFFGATVVRTWGKRQWYGSEPFRILVLHGKKGTEPSAVEIISIWPDTKKTMSLSIPPDLVIGTVGGYGNYRLAAQVTLGQVEGVGDRLIKDSLGFTLGIPIHQVVWQQKTGFDGFGAAFMSLRQGLSGSRSLPESIDLATLFFKMRNFSAEHVTFSRDNVVSMATQADGTSSPVFGRALLTRFMVERLSTFWKDAALTQVAVINASGKPQMATQWSLYAQVGGFDVVSVADSPSIQEKTHLVFSTKSLADSTVGKTLVYLYPHSIVEIGNTSSYRSQVAVVLGLDSWHYLTDRQTYLSITK